MNYEPEPWETIPGQLPLGHISLRASPYDGLTDEEAEQLKRELVDRERRRIPIGFAIQKRRRKR